MSIQFLRLRSPKQADISGVSDKVCPLLPFHAVNLSKIKVNNENRSTYDTAHTNSIPDHSRIRADSVFC